MRDANGNVNIMVPAAVAAVRAVAPSSHEPSKDEIIQWQGAQIRELEKRIAKQNIAGAQIIHVGLALAEYLIDLGHGLDADTVAVPVELRKRIGEANHLTISEGLDGCYIIKVRERGEPEDVSIAREQ